MTRSEVLAMEHTTTFGKQNRVNISRNLAAVIAAVFIACLVATGLLVYHFSSCNTTYPSCADPHQPKITQASSSSSSLVPNKSLHALPPDSPSFSASDRNENVKNSQVPVTEPSTTTTSSSSSPPINEIKPNVRLGRSILPHSYNIKLIPFIQEGNFTFHGEIAILLEVLESSWNITMHADELIIDEPSVSVVQVFENSSAGNGSVLERTVAVRHITNNTKLQFLTIELEQSLCSGCRYRLYMSYTGFLNNNLQGFYRSSYMVKNETRWLASTQFQPTDARKAFPCFDEPSFKAKFKISIGRHVNMSSISNMPRATAPQPIKGMEDYVWDHYQESVPMSTYLVAFVVSDFEHLTNGSISVWARNDAISQAKYSLTIAPSILSYFEEYFKIKFPLPKLDMIALPDFSAGAMENWGLITYRETTMLYKEGVSKITSLQRIASVIAHELAHQWFGNLVTPSWWSDLWLNEGFASYVEYIGTNAINPEWRMLDQFVIQDLHMVFALDALKSSHQISVPVGHPDEINDIFDRISYAKGSSIIRMMDHFLSNAVFKQGLTNYLNKKKYSSAEQDDLWDALTEQAHRDNALNKDITVKEIMDTWTLQTGFPVVTAIRNYEDKSLTLTQKRFLLIGKDDGPSPLWWIPITYTSSKNPQSVSKTWIRRVEQDTQPLKDLSSADWLLLNYHQSGYYRVNYDERNWRLLTDCLMNKDNYTSIHPTNRAQLLDDSLNLALAGLLNYEIALNLTRYLVHERDYIPWHAALNDLEFLVDMLQHSGSFDKLKAYMLSLISGIYNELGFKDEPTDNQLNIRKRSVVLMKACSLGHRSCVQNAVTHFQNWLSSPDPDRNNPIPPNLRSVVYCTAIRVGGEEEWNFAWERYKKSNVGSEKEELLSTLGCSRETWILARYLDRTINESSGIRKQDVPRAFISVSNNVVGQELVFRFIRSNWKRMKDYLGTSFNTINHIVKTCTMKFNTEYELSNLKNFVEMHKPDFTKAPRPVEQAIEQVSSNVEWMEKNYNTIVEWLSSNIASS